MIAMLTTAPLSPPKDQVITVIDEATPREPYQHGGGTASSQCRAKNKHMGQVKLLLSEIDFLGEHAREGDTVVYVGAACGMHIPTLDAMFSTLCLRWHLYDPDDFSTEVHAWCTREGVSSRVRVCQKLFTDADATSFRESNATLLISDIRSSRTDPSSGHHSDADIVRDQAMQMGWVMAMNPRACCLKFRGIFGYTDANRYFQYLKGEMRLQV